MNQFSNYNEQLKKCSRAWQIANEFDFILNNIWCTYSFEKGNKKWREIGKDIPSPFYEKICIEMGHVELGHGREQALMAVKSEMSKYIDFLLNLYDKMKN